MNKSDLMKALFLSLLITASLAIAGDVTDEKKLFVTTLSPAKLSSNPAGMLSTSCSVINNSNEKTAVIWDSPVVFLWPGEIVIKTFGSKTKNAENLLIDPGETRSMTINVDLGEVLPPLDEGEYKLRVQICLDRSGENVWLEKSAIVTIKNREEDINADGLTTSRLVSVAKQYSENHNQREPQIIDYTSYKIGRYGDDWIVSFLYQGPKLFGTRTVSVNSSTGEPYFRPIVCFLK